MKICRNLPNRRSRPGKPAWKNLLPWCFANSKTIVCNLSISLYIQCHIKILLDWWVNNLNTQYLSFLLFCDNITKLMICLMMVTCDTVVQFHHDYTCKIMRQMKEYSIIVTTWGSMARNLHSKHEKKSFSEKCLCVCLSVCLCVCLCVCL